MQHVQQYVLFGDNAPVCAATGKRLSWKMCMHARNKELGTNPGMNSQIAKAFKHRREHALSPAHTIFLARASSSSASCWASSLAGVLQAADAEPVPSSAAAAARPLCRGPPRSCLGRTSRAPSSTSRTWSSSAWGQRTGSCQPRRLHTPSLPPAWAAMEMAWVAAPEGAAWAVVATPSGRLEQAAARPLCRARPRSCLGRTSRAPSSTSRSCGWVGGWAGGQASGGVGGELSTRTVPRSSRRALCKGFHGVPSPSPPPPPFLTRFVSTCVACGTWGHMHWMANGCRPATLPH